MVAAPYDRIRYEVVAEHVVRIVLDRPQVANALDMALFVELDHAISQIEQDEDVRVWLLTGAPRNDGRPWFSAGADFAMARESESTPHIDPASVVERIDQLLKPSIAVIDGMCTTGALELAMACDLRIAARSARLSDWHLKATGLGIGQWGAAARLSRLVGVDKAKELLLTGVEISGTEAARIGLVNRVVAAPELDALALGLAKSIAAMPPTGVRTTLGYLALQSDMTKAEALHWADLAPGFMGVRLRPFGDAAERFAQRARPDSPSQ
jgi:enoyl-CoA hydratase/carnithine racemase